MHFYFTCIYHLNIIIIIIIIIIIARWPTNPRKTRLQVLGHIWPYTLQAGLQAVDTAVDHAGREVLTCLSSQPFSPEKLNTATDINGLKNSLFRSGITVKTSKWLS